MPRLTMLPNRARMTGTEKLRMTMESSRDSAMIPRLPIQPRNSQKIQESGTRPGRPARFSANEKQDADPDLGENGHLKQDDEFCQDQIF